VRNGEERPATHGKDGLLLFEVLDTDGKDGATRRALVTEPLDVRLAERSLPRKDLAGDEPRAVAVTISCGDLGRSNSRE
jgi:hypothetical protein